MKMHVYEAAVLLCSLGAIALALRDYILLGKEIRTLERRLHDDRI